MNTSANDATVSSEQIAYPISGQDKQSEDEHSLVRPTDSTYITAVRSKPASKFGISPSFEQIVQIVYPYVNTNYEAEIGVARPLSNTPTTTSLRIQNSTVFSASSIYSCFNYHTHNNDFVHSGSPTYDYYIEAANHGTCDFARVSSAGIIGYSQVRETNPVRLQTYTSTGYEYSIAERAQFSSMLISSNDWSTFVSQVNANNPNFNAALTGKFAFSLPTHGGLAEFTPWFNFFCNFLNLGTSLFGNFTNSYNFGLRDRIVASPVVAAVRAEINSMRVSYCTMGTFMAMVSSPSVLPQLLNLSSFDQVVFVDKTNGYSREGLASVSTLHTNWDRYFKFVHPQARYTMRDGTHINRNVFLVHDFATVFTTPNQNIYILYVDVSDMRVGPSDIGEMCIVGLDFPQNLHDVFSPNWLPPDSLPQIAAAVGDWFNRPSTQTVAANVHNVTAAMYPCREAYDIGQYAALLCKVRDSANFQRTQMGVNNSEIVYPLDGAWSTDVTIAYFSGHNSNFYRYRGTLLTGQPLSMCALGDNTPATTEYGTYVITVPAPDPALQGALLAKIVRNPLHGVIPRCNSGWQSLLACMNTTASYISWWSDTIHEFLQAGWYNYWDGDQVGIVDTINQILKKTMLIGLSYQSNSLAYPPLTANDINASGQQFTQNHVNSFAMHRTPSGLFCVGSPEEWVVAPIESNLVKNRYYDITGAGTYIYGDHNGSEISDLGGRHFLETLPAPSVYWQGDGITVPAERPINAVFPLWYFYLMKQEDGPIVLNGTTNEAHNNVSLSRDFIRRARRREVLSLRTSYSPTLITPSTCRIIPDMSVQARQKVRIIGANRDRVITRALDSINL